MDIDIKFDPLQLSSVRERLSAASISMPKVIAAAVNDTAKQQKIEISSNIRQRVNIKKKDIDPRIKITRATASNPGVVITLSKSARLNLKYFGARQTKKGVTYQIDKNGGRKLLAGAFGPLIAALNNLVFRRVGKKRLPIIPLKGPSPWGVFVKSGLRGPTIASCRAMLRNNLERRVRFELLKKAGKVGGGGS